MINKWNLLGTTQMCLVFLFIQILNLPVLSQTPQPNREIYQPPDLAPKPAEAANLFRFSEVPVDLSSGSANVNIPIYTINSGRIRVPVSITYNTSGIKIQDIASPVGLGWSLSPAYVVSIDGETDFDDYFRRSIKTMAEAAAAVSTFSQLQTHKTQLLDVSNGYYPQEHLKFHFKCGDITGTFLYDHNDVLQIVSKTKNLKVQLDRFNNLPYGEITGCTITTNEGIEYHFTNAESYINPRKSSSQISSVFYATDIKDLVSGETVHFIYRSKPVYTDYRSESYSKSATEALTVCYPHCWSGAFDISYNNFPFQIHGLVLETISFRNGYVKFETNDDRLDLDKTRLSAISIYDLSIPYPGRQIKKAVFNNQNYFLSDVYDAGLDTKFIYRLKLNDVTFYSDISQSLPIEKYSFEYNETVKLPAYRRNNSYYNTVTNNVAVDFWGYYNGKNTNQTLIPEGLPYYNQAGNATLAASSRIADPNYTQANILTKVTYPTGGFTTFEYENHRLNFECTGGSSTCTPGGYYLGDILGGLRVTKIKNYAGTSLTPDIERHYKYLSGVVLTPASKDMFAYNKGKTFISQSFEDSFITSPYHYYSQAGNPLYEIALHNSSPIQYNKVEEYVVANNESLGKKVHSYYTVSELALYSHNLIPEYGFKRKSILTSEFGIPEEIKTYKRISNSFALIRHEKFEYQTETGEVAPGLHISKNGIASSADHNGWFRSYDGVGGFWENMYNQPDIAGNFFIFYKPNYGYNFMRLAKKETIEYDDASNALTSSVNYFYDNPSHYDVTRIEHTDSDGSDKKTVNKYFMDRAQLTDVSAEETTAFSKLLTLNKVDDLLEQTNYVDGIKVEQKRIRFGIFNNANVSTTVPLVRYVERTITQNGVDGKKNETLSEYDAWSNILQREQENNIKIVYIWGYRSTYPIAEVKNASLLQVLTALGYTQATYELEAAKDVPSSDYLARIGTLRQNLPYTMVTTFSYKPLIGIISITDPNNMITNYEYDPFGRLQVIKDLHGSAVKAFDYHYRP